MRDLPRPAQFYIVIVFLVALTACLLAVPIILSRLEFLLASAALVVLVAFFDLRPVTGFKNVETTVSTAVKVAGILLFTPAVVIISVFLGTTLAESRLERATYKKMLNIGAMTLTYTVMAWVYTIAQGGETGIVDTPRNLFALGVLAGTDLVVNSLSVSLAIALATGSSLRYIWTENFRPVIFHDMSMVPLGALLAILWQVSPLTVLFACTPLYLVQQSTKLINDLRRQTLDALMVLARMLDERDEDTHLHCEMVATHAEEIAREMKLSQSEIDIVRRAAYLHDIGKIGMSNAILYKAGALTTLEREAAKKHAVYGAQLLDQFPAFKRGSLYVRHHHERWDGGGYPDGIKGEDIPLGARILAVADSFQAMIEDRPYRKGFPTEVALKEVCNHAGTQFDPQVVTALMRVKTRTVTGTSRSNGHLVTVAPIEKSEPDKPSEPKLLKIAS